VRILARYVHLLGAVLYQIWTVDSFLKSILTSSTKRCRFLSEINNISTCGIASEKLETVKRPPMEVLIKALNEAAGSGDYEPWDESSHSNRLTLFDPEEKKLDECRHKWYALRGAGMSAPHVTE
jgi:hypothetical protein